MRPVRPVIPPAPTPAETTASAVSGVLARLHSAVLPNLDTCWACGCLCRDDEACPKCHPTTARPLRSHP